MTSGRFLFAIGWRTVAFVAVSYAFPQIIQAVQSMTGCAETERGCAAITMLSGAPLRLAILALFALSLIFPVWRRARTVGRSRFTALLVPALVLLDWRFLTALGGYLPVSFERGLLSSGLPFFTILAALIVLLLAVSAVPVAQPKAGRRAAGLSAWLACFATTVLGAVSAALFIAWLAAMASGSFTSPYAADAASLERLAKQVSLVAMAIIVLMTLYEIVRRPPREAPA